MAAMPIPPLNVSAPSMAQAQGGTSNAGGTARGGSITKIDLGPVAWVLGGLGALALVLMIRRGKK